MRLDINLSVGEQRLETVGVVFDKKITYDTIDDAKKMLEEVLERHFRKHKELDGRDHFSDRHRKGLV